MSNNIITPEFLLGNGYGKYRHDSAACEYALYQKTVRSPEGDRLYGITFYFSDLSREFPTAPKRTKIEVNVRFYLQPGDTLVGSAGFDMNLYLEPTATLEQVEALYARAYASLGCAPDWQNQ